MLVTRKYQGVTGLDVLLKSLKNVSIAANSVVPDEMSYFSAFHLGHHCLSKYPFRGFLYTKG